MIEDGIVIPELDANGVQGLIARGVAAGGMVAKLEAGLAALRGGVAAVRITALDGITDSAVGTQLVLSLNATRGAI